MLIILITIRNVFINMHNPPHPGSIIREDVLPELGLTVTEAARQLGISRVQLSRFINERSGVTPEMAIRLSEWIPAPTARMWLQMQADFDLWRALNTKRLWKVEPAHR